jgi:hypothetical protein
MKMYTNVFSSTKIIIYKDIFARTPIFGSKKRGKQNHLFEEAQTIQWPK